MESFNIRGLGVALVTPFKADKTIDFDAMARLLEHQISGGSDYLVVLGTTGETPTLTCEEKLKIREFVSEKVAGRLPLVIGIGGNCTASVVDELTHADLSGYSAVLSVTPYYNKPTQRGLYQHFEAIAEASPLPVILYNVPGRTGVNLTADTTLRLARDFRNIVAIKEASGQLKQIEEIIYSKPEDFKVVSGDDSLTYSLIKMGADGVISVVGNAYPREFGTMVRKCLEKKYEEARKIDNEFARLYEVLFRDGNPAGIKSLLHVLGMIENELRLPLVPTNEDTDRQLEKFIYHFANFAG